MRHDQLLEAAREAISDVFSDTTVDREKTMESMEDLLDEIRENIECLKVDARIARKGVPNAPKD